MIDWSGVEINDEHVAALHRLLLDGPEAWAALQSEMAVEQSAAAYVMPVNAAFSNAVYRKFSPTYSAAGVARYVADLRISMGETTADLNPRIAEDLIRRCLGDQKVQQKDKTYGPSEEATTVYVLLIHLLAEDEPDEATLERHAHEAAELARRWVRDAQAAQEREQAARQTVR